MFRYFLTFLLINTCYQSLGNPIQPSAPNQLLSKSLTSLADQCKNSVLSRNILELIKDCAVFVPPYSKKQYQCMIFYDINMQLCSAVASSKITVSEDSFSKVQEKQDVNAVCALAKDWVFTNISEFANYKESAEKFFKLPATCGEVCGVEDTMTEANYYCKYYKTGLEILKTQLASTMANNANNNAVAAPLLAVSESDISARADIPIPAISNPVMPQDKNTKIMDGQIRQTEPAVAKTTPRKIEETNDNAVKSETVAQVTPKQTPSTNAVNIDNIDDNVNVNRQEDPIEPVVPAPGNVISHNDQVNKTSIVVGEKPAVENELAVPDLPAPANGEQKAVPVIENPKQKAIGDNEEYADSDGNEGDDENEDPGLEIKSDQEPQIQQTFVRNKLVVPAAHESEVLQKEIFPVPDDFSDEENDHFFPFFMTSVVLMVLLYVLYHNKSKVSKVFFGLILEGRQSGRRRNSRGHAYRRLDTLEQAMSANTAAPPSKIIY